MSDYKQRAVNGTAWQRPFQIVIDNPLGETPRVSFLEEEILTVDGQTIRKGVPGINIGYTPDAVIDLLDPTTGLPLGQTMTHAQMYVAIWSLYRNLAAARDAGL